MVGQGREQKVTQSETPLTTGLLQRMKPQEKDAEGEQENTAPHESRFQANLATVPVQCKVGTSQSITEKETKRPNQTGLPDDLKAGLEQLSGLDMSDVRVHYNSSKPAELNALAYAQGNDIHMGSGQENHLPHEGWHVVQQMQGRVKPTMQSHGVAVNDDQGLEREAEQMGEKAAASRSLTNSVTQKKRNGGQGFGIFDNRSEAVAHQQLQEKKNNFPLVKQSMSNPVAQLLTIKIRNVRTNEVKDHDDSLPIPIGWIRVPPGQPQPISNPFNMMDLFAGFRQAPALGPAPGPGSALAAPALAPALAAPGPAPALAAPGPAPAPAPALTCTVKVISLAGNRGGPSVRKDAVHFSDRSEWSVKWAAGVGCVYFGIRSGYRAGAAYYNDETNRKGYTPRAMQDWLNDIDPVLGERWKIYWDKSKEVRGVK